MSHAGEVQRVAIRKARRAFNHFLKCRLCGAVYRDDSPNSTKNFCSTKCLSEAHNYVVPKFLLSKKLFNTVQREAWEYGVHAEEIVRRIVVEHYRITEPEKRCDVIENRLKQFEDDLQKIAARAIIAESRTRPPSRQAAKPLELSQPEPIPDESIKEFSIPITPQTDTEDDSEEEKELEESDNKGEVASQDDPEEDEYKDNDEEAT